MNSSASPTAGRGGVEQPPIRPKRRVSDERRNQHGAGGGSAALRGCHLGVTQISSRAEEQEEGELERDRAVGAGEQRAIEQILEQLGLNVGARHALAERRVLVIDQAECRRADQDELALQRLGIDFALEARRSPGRSGAGRAANSRC